MMRVYGWKPDRPDFRDQIAETEATAQAALPISFSLRSTFPAPYDQAELGSCTSNALAGAVTRLLMKENKLTLATAATVSGTPSRLFIYYNERVIEGTVSQDSGATIRDGIKALNTLGTCFESTWPYIISQFARKPSVTAYKNALQDVVKSYQRINTADKTTKKTVLTQGSAIAFGFSVYDSFESAAVEASGLVPMPSKSESLLGGHAMLIVGYDDNKVINGQKGAYECRNSWGPNWGDHGYCYMPYSYLDDNSLADDFWIIKLI